MGRGKLKKFSILYALQYKKNSLIPPISHLFRDLTGLVVNCTTKPYGILRNSFTKQFVFEEPFTPFSVAFLGVSFILDDSGIWLRWIVLLKKILFRALCRPYRPLSICHYNPGLCVSLCSTLRPGLYKCRPCGPEASLLVYNKPCGPEAFPSCV